MPFLLPHVNKASICCFNLSVFAALGLGGWIWLTFAKGFWLNQVWVRSPVWSPDVNHPATTPPIGSRPQADTFRHVVAPRQTNFGNRLPLMCSSITLRIECCACIKVKHVHWIKRASHSRCPVAPATFRLVLFQHPDSAQDQVHWHELDTE